MKRRLRKKKRLGEFKEMGFEIVARFVPRVAEEAWMAFFAATEAISHTGPNGAGLCVCTGGGPHGAFTVVTYCSKGHRSGRHINCGSATEEHRRFVEEFLKGRSEIARFIVGPLFDVWSREPQPEVDC